MLDLFQLFQRLVLLDWTVRGARFGAVSIRGARVSYAEFRPRPRDLAELRAEARRQRRPGRLRIPTVVLFHGLGATGTSFHPVIPRLRRT